MRGSDYIELDATALAAAVRRGEVSPTQLLERAIARIDERNADVNAVVRTLYDEAYSAIDAGLPDGPLLGVPFLVKDLSAHLRGVPTTSGSRLGERFVPWRTSTVLQRYIDAGAVIIGKTNTSELGSFGVTEPRLYGPTRNPIALDRTPGGSSGGAAAAVASRMVPAAHGSDFGGSIRIPSSFTGLVGLKPSRGRVPLGPDLGAFAAYQNHHVLTRTVRDSALFLDVAAGAAPGEPYVAPVPSGPFVDEVGRDPGRLRIAFTDETLLPGETHPEVARAVLQTAKQCEELGHRAEPAHPELDGRALAHAFLITMTANVYTQVRRLEHAVKRDSADLIEPENRLLYELGRSRSAGELAEACGTAEHVGRVMAEFHRDYDVFMIATTAVPAPRIGEFATSAGERLGAWMLTRMPTRAGLSVALRRAHRGMLEAVPNTQPFNMSGQPAISMPLHTTEAGLPIGIQLVAPHGREDVLFRLASQLESASAGSTPSS